MSAIRLLLDEDVRPLLAEVLQSHGYDVVAVGPLGMGGTPDPALLTWAVQQKRAILTHNTSDFVPLAGEYARNGWDHYGIIVSVRLPFRVLLARIFRLLAQKQSEDLHNRLEWLQNYR